MPDYDYLIADFQSAQLPSLTPRDVVLPGLAKKPDVIIGMRRTGKTFVLHQQIQRLLAEGTDRRDILYVNFEDDRLHPLADTVLDDVLETFFRFNPSARDRGCHLFFDEIQVVPGFARFLRRVVDTVPARVYVTGSSAALLHGDVATEFRGRGFAVEVFPMSFVETARRRGVVITGGPIGSGERSAMRAHLDWFLEVGGFPEVVEMTSQQRLQTLQDYVELVLLRDVIERHRIENAPAAVAFSRLLLQSSGRSFSVNKAYQDLRSRGFRVSKDTLHALVEHFQDAYLLHLVRVFSSSERVGATNPRKVYAADQGLAWAVSHVTATDLGARLETAVHGELRRRSGRLVGGQISYYITNAGHEVDFVVGDPLERSVSELVQVCVRLEHQSTREREIRALAAAMQELSVSSATIVTMNDSELVETDSGTIQVVPAWQWLAGRR